MKKRRRAGIRVISPALAWGVPFRELGSFLFARLPGKACSLPGRGEAHARRIMKTLLLALCPALMLAACAGPQACVTHTDVATGAANPKAIYIRPFQIADAPFDHCPPGGNTPLRKSLAPLELANALQEELAKIAPATVLKPCEDAPTGWLVDGRFEMVESGYSPKCWSPCGDSAIRPSCLKLHVRVTDMHCGNGRVVYEFDVAAGSTVDRNGSIYSPGMGYPLPFDFRNAAELIALTLTPDPFRYGVRNSPVMRY